MRFRLLVAAAVSLPAACADPAANHAPVFLPMVDRCLAIAEPMSSVVSAVDPDQDVVTLVLEEAPAGAALVDGVLTWTPSGADLGMNGFVISATDDGDPALVAYLTFVVAVYDPATPPPNHAPEIAPIAAQRLEAGQQVSFQVVASDPDGDELAFDLLMLPPGAEFDELTGMFLWTPQALDGGMHYASFRVVDDGAPPLRAQISVPIEVLVEGAPNLPPILWSVAAPGNAEPCVPFVAAFEAMDPEGDEIVYTSPALPAGATLDRVGSAAVLSFTPTSAQSGTHVVIIYALDDGDPPMADAIAYTIDVPALPPLEIAPIAATEVNGGELAAMAVAYPHNACYAMDVVSTLPVTWDGAAEELLWVTEDSDFGLYDVLFELRDTSDPAAPVAQATGRYVIRFEDDFEAFEGYGTHEVHLDWCCVGPANYEVLQESTLHVSSDLVTDVHGRAYRTFDRSQVPFQAVAYEVQGYDHVVGPACGSGGNLLLYDFAVTDPAIPWPSWGAELPPVLWDALPDGSPGLVSGTTVLAAARTDLTLALLHWDVSNICSVDAYYDRVLITPIETVPVP
jgi:hypothetical protein